MQKWIAIIIITLVILLDVLTVYSSFLTNNVFTISWGFWTYSSLLIFNVFAITLSYIFYQSYKELCKEKEDYQ